MQLVLRGEAPDLDDIQAQLMNLLQTAEALKKQQNSIESDDGFETFLELYRHAFFKNENQSTGHDAEGCQEAGAVYQVTRNYADMKKHAFQTSVIDEVALANERDKLTDEGWLTTSQIAALGGYSTKNVSAQPTKWKSAGKIFSVIKRGTGHVYPRYGLDESCRPLRVMKVILDTFANHKSSWGLAEWFATSKPLLAGKAPKEMLLTHPANVIQAAEYEVRRVSNGEE